MYLRGSGLRWKWLEDKCKKILREQNTITFEKAQIATQRILVTIMETQIIIKK